MVIALTVTQSPERLWKQVRDLPRFLTIDPFHDQVTLMRDEPAEGVDLVLSHNAFGRRFLRFGRIVAWQEACGYTFSDLSARGPRTGFPHVFMVQIEPLAVRRAHPSFAPDDSRSRPVDVAAGSGLAGPAVDSARLPRACPAAAKGPVT